MAQSGGGGTITMAKVRSEVNSALVAQEKKSHVTSTSYKDILSTASIGEAVRRASSIDHHKIASQDTESMMARRTTVAVNNSGNGGTTNPALPDAQIIVPPETHKHRPTVVLLSLPKLSPALDMIAIEPPMFKLFSGYCKSEAMGMRQLITKSYQMLQSENSSYHEIRHDMQGLMNLVNDLFAANKSERRNSSRRKTTPKADLNIGGIPQPPTGDAPVEHRKSQVSGPSKPPQPRPSGTHRPSKFTPRGNSARGSVIAKGGSTSPRASVVQGVSPGKGTTSRNPSIAAPASGVSPRGSVSPLLREPMSARDLAVVTTEPRGDKVPTRPSKPKISIPRP